MCSLSGVGRLEVGRLESQIRGWKEETIGQRSCVGKSKNGKSNRQGREDSVEWYTAEKSAVFGVIRRIGKVPYTKSAITVRRFLSTVFWRLTTALFRVSKRDRYASSASFKSTCASFVDVALPISKLGLLPRNLSNSAGSSFHIQRKTQKVKIPPRFPLSSK